MKTVILSGAGYTADEWRSVMQDSAAIFRHYEALHKAKGGIADDKAERNRLAAERIEVLLQSKQAPANEQVLDAPWAIRLFDMADGVKGHYAIGRYNPEGFYQYWNLKAHKWAACSDEVLTIQDANSLLEKIIIPTKGLQSRPAEPVINKSTLDTTKPRYIPTKGAYWWSVKIGDGQQTAGKFHTENAALEMAAVLECAFQDGIYVGCGGITESVIGKPLEDLQK